MTWSTHSVNNRIRVGQTRIRYRITCLFRNSDVHKEFGQKIRTKFFGPHRPKRMMMTKKRKLQVQFLNNFCRVPKRSGRKKNSEKTISRKKFLTANTNFSRLSDKFSRQASNPWPWSCFSFPLTMAGERRCNLIALVLILFFVQCISQQVFGKGWFLKCLVSKNLWR